MPGLIASLVLILLLNFYFLLCDKTYRITADRTADPLMFAPKNAPNADDFAPWLKYMDQIKAGQQWYAAQTHERVTITSDDGLTLVAEYLPCPGADTTLLMAHGYRSATPAFDFSCAAEPLHARFNLLLIHQRAHGESEGRYIGFGVRERHDIVRWAEFLNARYHPRAIILDGMSMGAASVLMALDLDLPENVIGAVADSGFTTPRAIVTHVIRAALPLPSWLIWPGITLCARLRSGYFMGGASTIRSVGRARVPVLFIHGEDDRYVPCDMGRANHTACASPKQIVTVPGAGHGLSYLIDREKVGVTLNAFLDSLPKP